MHDQTVIARFSTHRNAFGFLRLFFASLVIVSHTPEMADGNRNRELLSRVFHTMSFGELAVSGFFTISGYLIVGSFLKQPKVFPYLLKRIARIYPGFIVASLVSLLIFAPLGGASYADLVRGAGKSILRILLLAKPDVTVFPGTNNAEINGAMWTIAIEFRCYVLVIILSKLGVLSRPIYIATLALIFMILSETFHTSYWDELFSGIPLSEIIFSQVRRGFYLTAVFLVGGLFYIYKDKIRYSRSGILIAIFCLGLFMCWSRPAVIGMATFGAYLIFAVATLTATGPLSRINNRNDISYGVYLYAWPIGKLLLWYFPNAQIAFIGLATFLLACACGWLSWHFVEKPVMGLLRKRDPASPPNYIAATGEKAARNA